MVALPVPVETGEREEQMRSYLVVIHPDLDYTPLVEKAQEFVDREPSCFDVLVPANDSLLHEAFRGDTTDAELTAARMQLDNAFAALQSTGAQVSGKIVTDNETAAIGCALAERDYDEIILLTTRPLGFERWLNLDEYHRIKHTFNVPITMIYAHHVKPTPKAASV